MNYDLQKTFWKSSGELVSRETISWSPQLKKAAYRDEQSKGRAKQSCKTQTVLITSLSLTKSMQEVKEEGAQCSHFPAPKTLTRGLKSLQGTEREPQENMKEFVLKIVEGEGKNAPTPPFLNFP